MKNSTTVSKSENERTKRGGRKKIEPERPIVEASKPRREGLPTEMERVVLWTLW